MREYPEAALAMAVTRVVSNSPYNSTKPLNWGFFYCIKGQLMIKRLIVFFVLLIGLVFISRANAQVNVFTDHQVVYMTQHGVNKHDDVRFPTGDYPYIGRIGLEYQRKNWAYQLAYIHRSNVDISGQDEYNYNGIAVGIKYAHCLIRC